MGKAGLPVMIGSRDTGRAGEAAEKASKLVSEGSFAGLKNDEAVREADLVVLSVPFRNQSETLTNLKGALQEGQLLVDATVPLAAAVGNAVARAVGMLARRARVAGPCRLRVQARRLGEGHS